MHSAVGNQYLRPVDDLRKRRLVVAAHMGVDLPHRSERWHVGQSHLCVDAGEVHAFKQHRLACFDLLHAQTDATQVVSGAIGCLHLAHQFRLGAFEHDPAALLQLRRRVVAQRKRRTEGSSAQAVYAADPHLGRRELDVATVGKWRCTHLARMFLGRAARIVEHLDADVVGNLLSERLRQLNNLKRLVDVAQQIGSEQAVALASGRRVERVPRAGQHPLQARRKPT